MDDPVSNNKNFYNNIINDKSFVVDNRKQKDESNESKVWNDFKNGSEEALIYIYRNYSNILFNYASQFTRNRELVKDSIQELFFELINSRKHLGNTTSIKFYLFKCLRRKLTKKINKESLLTLNIKDNVDQFIIRIDPETILINNQIDENQKILLNKAIKQLKPRQREAVLLYFYEGFSYQKIAEIFELANSKSARTLIYRAIESIAERLKNKDIFFYVLILISLLFC